MKTEDLQRLRELGEKATAAEWSHDDGEIIASGAVLAQVFGADDYPCCDEDIDAECKANAELICLMRNNLTSLLDAAERVERQWISVEDEFPERPESNRWRDGRHMYGISDPVLIRDEKGRTLVGTIYENNGIPTTWAIEPEGAPVEVTHWMPLPAAPPAAEKEGE